MNKRILCLMFTACMLILPVSADAEQEAVVVSVPDTQGMQVGAAACIVMEAGTGRVLFAQNAQDRLPMASTTKIMTALIALEQNEIDAVFEVNADAIQVEGSSMGLQAGDKVSLRVLAVGMLLASGNDAANAAAVRISGSVEDFVARMNRRARELGMCDTSFETPSGLDGEHHYSTAYDMAILTRHALQNDHFAAICSEYKMRTEYGNPPYPRWLTNHNKLLNYYEGTIGVKTGFTRKAGRCLVSAAQRDGIQLICVTLNCPDDWNIHQTLYDRYFSELRVEDLSEGIGQLSVPVTGGISPFVGAVKYENARLAVPIRGADIRYDIVLQPFLYAPVRRGQPVGEARILLDGEIVARLTLISDRDVAPLHEYEEEKSLWQWIAGLFWDGG